MSCPEIALHLKVIKYEKTRITKSQIKEEQLSPKVRKLRGIFKSENDLNYKQTLTEELSKKHGVKLFVDSRSSH